MKKYFFGLLTLTLMLAIGCSEYESETFPMSEYESGIAGLLDNNPAAMAVEVASFSDLRYLDSSMTIDNFDSLFAASSNARTKLADSLLAADTAVLKASEYIMKVALFRDLNIVMLDLTGKAVDDYILYFDKFIQADLYSATGTIMEVDRSFPQTLVLPSKSIKEKVQAQIGGAKYYLVIRRNEASKGIPSVNLVINNATYAPPAAAAALGEMMRGAASDNLQVLSPGDLDTAWVGLTINTGFLSNDSIIGLVKSRFKTYSGSNSKVKALFSENRSSGYFILSTSSTKTVLLDKKMDLTFYSGVDGAVLAPDMM
ncbi:MAG TPA: hypothetical protein ENN84_06045, partial [Candidatus Marinimicrobia bacterium]|nr:hypothetical protein [Candidatus Neomarinimicrobiota bacterium]